MEKIDSRPAARITAMKLLYEWEMGGDGGEDTRAGLLEIAPGGSEADYMESLVFGVRENTPAIDKAIEAFLTGWRLDRLRRVDLVILRLAVYELLYAGMIPAVAINEAVEMAHAYSTPEAGPFVNGILGALARDKGL